LASCIPCSHRAALLQSYPSLLKLAPLGLNHHTCIKFMQFIQLIPFCVKGYMMWAARLLRGTGAPYSTTALWWFFKACRISQIGNWHKRGPAGRVPGNREGMGVCCAPQLFEWSWSDENNEALLFQWFDLLQVEYPEIEEGIKPRYRFMSAYEQRVEPTDKNYMWVVGVWFVRMWRRLV
jgi:hypothetical protein